MTNKPSIRIDDATIKINKLPQVGGTNTNKGSIKLSNDSTIEWRNPGFPFRSHRIVATDSEIECRDCGKKAKITEDVKELDGYREAAFRVFLYGIFSGTVCDLQRRNI